MHPGGLGFVTSPTMSEETAQGALKAAKDKSRCLASLGLLHLTAHIRWVAWSGPHPRAGAGTLILTSILVS